MSDITWFGHSAFKISAPGAQVIIDPFFAPSAGVTADAAGDVDIVLVTHDHADHVGDAVSLCRRTGAVLGAIVGTAGKLAEEGMQELEAKKTAAYARLDITRAELMDQKDFLRRRLLSAFPHMKNLKNADVLAQLQAWYTEKSRKK